MKEKHAIEQAKLEAIDSKIIKARKRMEEQKREKAAKVLQSQNNRAGMGKDLEDELGLDDFDMHVPRIGGRPPKGY